MILKRSAVAFALSLGPSAAFAFDCNVEFAANGTSAGGSVGVYDCQTPGAGGMAGDGWNTTFYTGLVFPLGQGKADRSCLSECARCGWTNLTGSKAPTLPFASASIDPLRFRTCGWRL